MDLRPYLSVKPALFQQGVKLVRNGEFWYQPFILADGFEVGEGQNLADRYQGCQSLFDWNVYLSKEHLGAWDGKRVLAPDPVHFARSNQRYRLCYERIADTVAKNVELSSSSVLELGCNTGLNLFNLAVRGAKNCVGVDWTDYTKQFKWLNETLGTDVKFQRGIYDNVAHRLDRDPGEFDVVINTVFLNHQSDPLHCLSYLADRARNGLFLWILLNDSPNMDLRYGDVSGVHDLGSGKPFPLSFHNDVTVSRSLLSESFRRLGFGNVSYLPEPTDPESAPPTGLAPFTMLYAERTSNVKSALSNRKHSGFVSPPAGNFARRLGRKFKRLLKG